MKTGSVEVAVVILAFIYIQQSSTLPLTEVQELGEEMAIDNSVATEEETSVETWMMPYDIRQNGYSGPVRCHLCCDCCIPDVCSMCCNRGV